MHSPDSEPALVGLTYGNFDLHRQGQTDQEKFKKRVEKTVRDSLPGIVGSADIISSNGKDIIRVRVPDLQIPRFRHGNNSSEGIGQGSGQSGDVIGEAGQGPGQGRGAGNMPGVDYIDAEYTVDELAAFVLKDLGLPYLRPKSKEELVSESIRFNDIRKKGPMSNLDKRRTILENLKQNARDGDPKFRNIKDDQLRFKTWETDTNPKSNAVILAMRDVSGSMGEFEKYISRSLYFWGVRFLRSKYDQVQIVFITHHTEAKEVDEHTFFAAGESGGTKVSPAYQLALDIMRKGYPSALWNRYPMHVSDGDNWGDADNNTCVELIDTMLKAEDCSAFGYFEVREGGQQSNSTLMNAFRNYPNPRLIKSTIGKREDVYPALSEFFDPKKQEGGARQASV